jgi:DNA-binding GntR family transcriptional regulator
MERVQRAPNLIRSQVAAYLREAISDGRLLPGQQLVEREICEETTASRASVREALRELEANGLVVSEPGRGSTVARLSETEACRCYEIRAALEGVAAWRFAQYASDEDLERLGQVVDGMADLTETPAALLRAKNTFYDVLFEGAGNAELARLLDQLHLRVNMARAASLAAPGRPAESLAELRGIVEAARRRDPQETSRRCVQHVLNAAKTAIGPEAASTICAPMLWAHAPTDSSAPAAAGSGFDHE